MSPSEPKDPTSEKDVLANRPRSRRQRPSARREAARMSQASAKAAAANSDAADKLVTEIEPLAPLKTAEPKRSSSVPRAGYATPDQGKNFGNADPAGLLTELTRAALRLLPG